MVIDTNHMLFETPQHYIRKIGNKIKSLHVSDRDFDKERHYMTGYGILNWKEIISALEEIKYNGVFMFEIYFKCELYEHTVSEIKNLCDNLFDKYNDEK